MNKNKAVIYVRVSTDDQAREGHSIETQLEKCQKLCDAKDFEILDTFIEPGRSGSDSNRPEYLRMIELIKTGVVDYVVSIKLDRLNRSALNSEKLYSILMTHKTTLDLVLESTDINSPSGRFQARISAAHGELVREEIQERTIMGVRQATLNGNVSGRPAFGYIKDISNPIPELRKKVIIHEENADIVREVFNLCANGLSYHHIANKMKEEYPDALSWKDSAIQRILNNKWYIGILEYGKSLKNGAIEEIRGVIPPIIDEELFNQCQNQIRLHGKNYHRKHEYLFLKKIVCPHCTDNEHIMAGHSSYNKGSSLYLYYKCPNCDGYISETKLIDRVRLDLDDIYENYGFLLDIDNTSIPNTHDLRFIQDGSIFRRKLKSYNTNFTSSFEHLNGDEQRQCIDSLIEKVYLKQIDSEFQIDHVEFKNHQINLLHKLSETHKIDEVKGQYNHSVSISEMKPLEFEGYLNELTDIVENFAGIDVIELKDYEESLLNDAKLLKVVKILPQKKIFKCKYAYLYLNESSCC